MEMLTVKNLCFSYDTRQILHNIGFCVQPGTICGLLGPNASGKTTLFKCINGILKPQRGDVVVDGKKIAHLSRKDIAAFMAVVPQHAVAAFSFTALQMVVMAKAAKLGVSGRPSRNDYRDAEYTLDELGVKHLKDRPFNALSGGERQIVLLARALFQSPQILLLDEPTAHLDFKNQHLIMEMVQNITESKNLTTIITLHDPNLASRYCSQMVMLKQGQVYRQGMTKDVFEEDALESMYGIKVFIEESNHGKWFVIPPRAA